MHISIRYIQLLKDDPSLRVNMGEAGRQTVSKRAIEYVVKDLFEWYAAGKRVRQNRGLLFRLTCTLGLFASVPFTIGVFFVYNIMVCR